MIHSYYTETVSGIYRHLTVGRVRYPVAVEIRQGKLVPLRNDLGELLYATPGGGRATATELLAAAMKGNSR